MRRIPLALVIGVALGASACNDGPINYVPVPPVAIITGPQSFAPLDTATFDGSQSYVKDGTIEAWAWTITQRPGGSTAQPAPHPADPSKVDFFVDVSGDYTIHLVVTDNRGMTAQTDYSFSAVPWQTMQLEMTWDTDGTDVDLHLVDDTAGGNFFAKPYDCYFANTNPDWGQAGETDDNPNIDRDDTDGYGPEDTSLEVPLDGHVYHVYAHYYADNGVGSTNATVRIYLNGQLKFEGIQALAGTGDGWDVATITWPEGLVKPTGTMFEFSPP